MTALHEHDVDRNRPKPEGMATGIAHVVFRAMLTETSNPYLADRLPLAGYVKIIEFDIHGGVQPSGALFMPDPEPGKYTSFVEVKDARFEFGTRPVIHAPVDVEPDYQCPSLRPHDAHPYGNQQCIGNRLEERS